MTTPRTHYADHDEGILTRALCGQLPERRFATRDRKAVTCRSCLRKLSVVPFAPSELTEEEPWQPPDPKPVDVDRLTWLDLDPRTRKLAERNDESKGDRQRTWGSPELAWTAVRTIYADEYSAQSSSGGTLRVGELGQRVQTSGRSVNRCTKQAEMVAEIYWAARAALRDRVRLPAGVDANTAWSVWVDAKVGRPLTAREWAGRAREERTHFVVDEVAVVAGRYGLDAGLVTAVALEVHRALYAEMRDRGLCPGGGVRNG